MDLHLFQNICLSLSIPLQLHGNPDFPDPDHDSNKLEDWTSPNPIRLGDHEIKSSRKNDNGLLGLGLGLGPISSRNFKEARIQENPGHHFLLLTPYASIGSTKSGEKEEKGTIVLEIKKLEPERIQSTLPSVLDEVPISEKSESESESKVHSSTKPGFREAGGVRSVLETVIDKVPPPFTLEVRDFDRPKAPLSILEEFAQSFGF